MKNFANFAAFCESVFLRFFCVYIVGPSLYSRLTVREMLYFRQFVNVFTRESFRRYTLMSQVERLHVHVYTCMSSIRTLYIVYDFYMYMYMYMYVHMHTCTMYMHMHTHMYMGIYMYMYLSLQ